MDNDDLREDGYRPWSELNPTEVAEVEAELRAQGISGEDMLLARTRYYWKKLDGLAGWDGLTTDPQPPRDIPHHVKRGEPVPLEGQTPKEVWFYGADEDFDEAVTSRFGLKVSKPDSGHSATIVEIPALDQFYAVRKLFREMGNLGTVTDEWQDWIVDELARD